MYDELVKRLRNAAQWADKGLVITPSVCLEAADAIEELSRENKSLAKSVNEASEILRRRWIPVTERLPEKSGVYLGWMQWDLTDPDDTPSAYPIEYDEEEEAFGWWRSYFDPETLGWAGEDFIQYGRRCGWYWQGKMGEIVRVPFQPPKEES